ncbi:MAG: hypothetical protein GEV12_23190 [Micromonosporaceae bacterium]|nr:hypothetical protein [Micromonosporaceae bacterium]
MGNQEEYRQAAYQGERLGLRLNWQAVDELRRTLDRLAPGSSWGSRDQVRLRLPDGRDLTLTIAAVEDGAVLDEHGEYVGDDGLAHGDVTGDLDLHHDAAQVIGAVTRPPGYLELPLPGDADQEVDAGWLERRDRDVIDRGMDRLAGCYGGPYASSQQCWVDQVRERAERAAEATRGHRLAEAQRDAERPAETRAQRQAQPGPRPDGARDHCLTGARRRRPGSGWRCDRHARPVARRPRRAARRHPRPQRRRELVMTTPETTETTPGQRPVKVAEAEARLAGAEARVRAAQQQSAAADGLAADLQGIFDEAEQDRSAAEAELAAAELHLDQLADMDGVDGQVRAVAERRLADAHERWAWCERRAEDAWALGRRRRRRPPGRRTGAGRGRG